jgi:hypothetical protein
MLRRDFVRAVTAVVALPRLLFAQKGAQLPLPAPTPWTQGLNPQTHIPRVVVADAVADGELKFFTGAQMATLKRLSEMLVPAVGDKPGAIEAEAPAFFDFFIGKSPDSRKTFYTGGLNWIDAESVKMHKVPFAKLNDEQADALLKPWLRTWMSDHPPTEPHADFINIVHDELRTATVNSAAWSIASAGKGPGGLYWYAIEPDLRSVSAAAAHVPPHVQAVPKASHPMPSYPR